MPHPSRIRRAREQGYILITLVFFAAVIAIMAAAALPKIIQEVKRDKEEELVHRGVQYTRAIRLYYKKFGRYPGKIEDLESTNKLRFLRRRYKDPITGQDFKLLRYGDLPPSVAASLGGVAGIPVPGAPGAPGQGPGGIAAINPAAAQVLTAVAAQQAATPPPQPDAAPAADENNSGAANPATDSASGANPAAGPTNPTFGGGGIFGVVSASKARSIREFNKKDHYIDWLFIYAPSLDRGGLLTTPYQKPGANLLQPPAPGEHRVEVTE